MITGASLQNLCRGRFCLTEFSLCSGAHPDGTHKKNSAPVSMDIAEKVKYNEQGVLKFFQVIVQNQTGK